MSKRGKEKSVTEEEEIERERWEMASDRTEKQTKVETSPIFVVNFLLLTYNQWCQIREKLFCSLKLRPQVTVILFNLANFNFGRSRPTLARLKQRALSTW